MKKNILEAWHVDSLAEALGITTEEAQKLKNISMVKIEVKHRDCYGNDLIDVCDAHLSQVISRLTGKKTVSGKDLECLKALGCEVIDLDQVLKEMFSNK